MPTGYTAAVQDGKTTTLRDYALSCARAFGACIHMRDDNTDAPAPRAVPARSTHHDEALAKARSDLAALEALTPEQIEARSVAAFAEQLSHWRQRRLERDRVRANYLAMLSKVESWMSPTPDHAEFKSFMASQLHDSIKFDCSSTHDSEPEAPLPKEWLTGAIKDARWSVAYHEKELAAEIERHNGRNKWLSDLYDSLPLR